MKKPNHHYWVWLLAMLTLGNSACKTTKFKHTYKEVNALIHDNENINTKPFLKAHLINGDVILYGNNWDIDSTRKYVIGEGTRYDFNRHSQNYRAKYSVLIDSVALFETNAKLTERQAMRIGSIAVLTAANIALGIYCYTVEKACFGSCPTFYINENDNFHFADAEGFSNAILPSMAYADIDALNYTLQAKANFELTMKNEALETHCLRQINLLAIPKDSNENIFHTIDNQFVVCKNQYKLKEAKANEGNITQLLKNRDRVERFSLSDEHNLNSREEIYLTFSDVQDMDNLALNISFRQTLMTTFFIYSAMGYAGENIGDFFSQLEKSGNPNEAFKNGIKKSLGNIDVYIWNDQTNNWEIQGGFYETGPIAFNHQICRLNSNISKGDVKVKLVLNKGLWRIDEVGLTNVVRTVEPISIQPKSVAYKGKSDMSLLTQLNDSSKHLISMPGDEFKYEFEMPDSSINYMLFLKSDGYYIEWMRDKWIADKNLLKLRQMLLKPDTYLKRVAEQYKAYEAYMEQNFWDSKIDTKNFSYYEK